ncbi:uncharacterized protein EDB91DRAFT_1305077 [Suillus paluster]|uniref:uncharacterized protein n=1 Tax=Suillus paluster TaxID=48578 RepID=UPI001B85E16D|nr:uncharacterized protein EDB91DRAFT_1305077 [Suillus paluster]KAG1731857.1 hypothetical protein EDB91DRAFT_1305077 [Suillus paluster]
MSIVYSESSHHADEDEPDIPEDDYAPSHSPSVAQSRSQSIAASHADSRELLISGTRTPHGASCSQIYDLCCFPICNLHHFKFTHAVTSQPPPAAASQPTPPVTVETHRRKAEPVKDNGKGGKRPLRPPSLKATTPKNEAPLRCLAKPCQRLDVKFSESPMPALREAQYSLLLNIAPEIFHEITRELSVEIAQETSVEGPPSSTMPADTVPLEFISTEALRDLVMIAEVSEVSAEQSTEITLTVTETQSNDLGIDISVPALELNFTSGAPAESADDTGDGGWGIDDSWNSTQVKEAVSSTPTWGSSGGIRTRIALPTSLYLHRYLYIADIGNTLRRQPKGIYALQNSAAKMTHHDDASARYLCDNHPI